jgi:hypothetical protein
MSSDFRPERILEVLEKHSVDYVMIGGLAAAVHGSELATVDMDITPAGGHDNLTRLSAALRELNARIRTAGVTGGLPFSHSAASLAASGIWNLETDGGDLDISFVPSGTQGYPDLRRDAVAVDILGSTTFVASLADIIRSKEAAGRPKDIAAVPLLRRLLSQIERQRET